MAIKIGIYKECRCGTSFYIRPYAIKTNNYCSRKCASEAQHKQSTKLCSVCVSEYRVAVSQEKHRGESKYCSKTCKGIAMSKLQLLSANPAWRGGVSSINKRLRASKKYKTWREAVFARDNYTCRLCGVHGGYLEPDHIKPFAYFPDLRFELTNGRTLCKPCHKNTDTYGYKARRLYAIQDEKR